MLSLALLLITLYGLHLFLKWFLSNKRGRWATIVLFILHRIVYLMVYLFQLAYNHKCNTYKNRVTYSTSLHLAYGLVYGESLPT